jgi:hypothetical protein
MAKITTIVVSIAIIAGLTASMLVPRMTNPPFPPTLLNRTTILTDDNYEVGYPLNLTRGERVDVKVSGNGQPIDFRITDNQSSTLIEKVGDTFYDVPWQAPADGTYTFYISAYVGDVTTTVIVTET